MPKSVLRPRGDHILVSYHDLTTKSGIVLTESEIREATVRAVGPGGRIHVLEDHSRHSENDDLKPGMQVLVQLDKKREGVGGRVQGFALGVPVEVGSSTGEKRTWHLVSEQQVILILSE